MKVEDIAAICHEANRVYCQSLGDTSQPGWDFAPEWQKQSAIKGVQYHLSELNKGNFPDPAHSHECWLKEKEEAGWKYGPVKDPVKKEHPSCVPYEQLSLEEQRKDFIFSAIVAACSDVEAPLLTSDQPRP